MSDCDFSHSSSGLSPWEVMRQVEGSNQSQFPAQAILFLSFKSESCRQAVQAGLGKGEELK